MILKIADLKIVTRVYDHLYEETPTTLGKESVLLNFGLMLKNSNVDLEKLINHFKVVKEKGLERTPTLVLRYDTKQNNVLSYYIGAVAISCTKDGHPEFGCFVYKSEQYREYNGELFDWVEGRKTRGAYLKCTINDEAEIVAQGAGFDPIDLSDTNLLQMMSESIAVLAYSISRLPAFDTELTPELYREHVLNAMVDTRVNGFPALWNLTGWDLGLSPDGIIANNITYSS